MWPFPALQLMLTRQARDFEKLLILQGPYPARPGGHDLGRLRPMKNRFFLAAAVSAVAMAVMLDVGCQQTQQGVSWGVEVKVVEGESGGKQAIGWYQEGLKAQSGDGRPVD